MLERELKAAVADPEETRRRLVAAGARATFAGVMRDRRYDCDGTLAARDEVLRIREYHGTDGSRRARLAWKGPARVTDGYKLRPEHEVDVDSAVEADLLLRALGYVPVHAIDRYVEYYRVTGAIARLEWYPRMDPLLEIEGEPEAIEAAARAAGIPRQLFTAEPLALFLARYESRVGHPAAVSLASLTALGGPWPGWAGS